HIAQSPAKRVLYHKILDNKLHILRRYFKKAFPLISSWPAYKEFTKEEWVREYALYKVLKEKNQEKPWWQWSEAKNQPVDTDALNFHIFIQFLCFDQWAKVKDAADKEGVFLKGDIPILINRDSCDVWLHRDLFLLDYAAGAPPDMYNKEGQHWGF